MTIFTQYKGLSKSAYAMFFARMITNMGAFIWPMITLIMTTKLGYTATETGLIIIGVSVFYLPANIIGGKLADRYSKKQLIIFFDIVSAGFFFLAAFAGINNLMLIFFIIAGLAQTMEGASYDGLIVEVSENKDRERFSSLTYLGHNIGFMVAAAVAGFLIANQLSLAFIIDGITTLISTLVISLFVFPIKKADMNSKNEHEQNIDSMISGMTVLKNNKPIMILTFSIIFSSFVYEQWTFALPLHMQSLYGDTLGPTYYGFVAAFNGLLVILFTPLLTLRLKKRKSLPKMIIAASLYVTSFILLSITSSFSLGVYISLGIFFLFMFIFTLSEIINSISFNPYISRRVPNSHIGRISSYIGIGFFIGSSVGHLLMGWIIDNSPSFTIPYLIVSGAASMIVLLMSINYPIDKKRYPSLYESS